MVLNRTTGVFVEASIDGRWIGFFVNNPEDVIQRHHFAGEFYEMEELALMSRYMTPATRYLDVGTNVGNHVIYLSKLMDLSDIVVVEPNSAAIAILRINLLLNGIEQAVDTCALGFGLSDRTGKASMVWDKNNLGAAAFSEDGSGEYELRTGDALLAGKSFDFIKIDAEKMEIKCLNGLAGLIARCRPTMFVEVDDTNTAEFHEWCRAHHYVVREEIRRYPWNSNFLVAPADSSKHPGMVNRN